MRRRTLMVLTLAALVATVALACGAFDASESPVDADGGPPEAAADGAGLADVDVDASASEGGTHADADLDATLACAANPIQAPCSDPHWVFRPIAVPSSDGGAALTTGQTSEQGQVWWSEPHTADTFEATFSVTIGSGGGDGMAFAWLNLAAVPSAGGPGGNMGICSSGNPGFAVAIDTSPPAPATTPVLKLMSTLTANGCPDTPLETSALTGAMFPGTHTMKVLLAGTVVTVSFDGQSEIVHTLAGYVPGSAYFGFTAANGSVAAAVTVSGIRIKFLAEPTCP